MNNKFMLLIGLSVAFGSVTARADDGIKAFVVAALQANGQPVTGVLDGQIATWFRSQTKSMQPVQVAARMIRHLQPDGCGRVQIRFRQEVTMAHKTIEFPMEINYCVDGTVPLNITDTKGARQ
jgi:hypothetical protein